MSIPARLPRWGPRLPAVAIDRIRHPHALIVAPAVLNCFQHRADMRFGVLANQSGDSTHRLISLPEKPSKRLCQFLVNLVHLAEARC